MAHAIEVGEAQRSLLLGMESAHRPPDVGAHLLRPRVRERPPAATASVGRRDARRPRASVGVDEDALTTNPRAEAVDGAAAGEIQKIGDRIRASRHTVPRGPRLDEHVARHFFRLAPLFEDPMHTPKTADACRS